MRAQFNDCARANDTFWVIRSVRTSSSVASSCTKKWSKCKKIKIKTRGWKSDTMICCGGGGGVGANYIVLMWMTKKNCLQLHTEYNFWYWVYFLFFYFHRNIRNKPNTTILLAINFISEIASDFILNSSSLLCIYEWMNKNKLLVVIIAVRIFDLYNIIFGLVYFGDDIVLL